MKAWARVELAAYIACCDVGVSDKALTGQTWYGILEMLLVTLVMLSIIQVHCISGHPVFGVKCYHHYMSHKHLY